jgi:hypothetical protein
MPELYPACAFPINAIGFAFPINAIGFRGATSNEQEE